MAKEAEVPPAPEDLDLPGAPAPSPDSGQDLARAGEAAPPGSTGLKEKDKVYVLMPGEDEIFVDGILLRKRVNATLELQEFAVTKVKELMSTEIAKDPELAIGFLRATTDGAVKMVDAARKFAESVAKNESYFGKMRNERLRLFRGGQAPVDGDHTISPHEEVIPPAPTLAEAPPPPAAEEVPEPIIEPADLENSQFGDLHDLP